MDVQTLIELRRALPEPAGSAAVFAESEAEGLLLNIPQDPLWQLQVVPHGDRWQIVEIQQRPGPLPDDATVVAEVTDTDLIAAIDQQYRRLLLERRNAGCGTPTRAPGPTKPLG